MRTRAQGFTLVELLVAVLIGLIGSVIIFQVFATFEAQKRSTTGGSDTQVNLAVATNALERAGRHAGYGINFKSHLGCDVVIWKQDSRPAVPPALPDAGSLTTVKLVPANIVRDVGGNLTSLTFTGSRSDDTYSVTNPVTALANPAGDIKPTNIYGIDQGDLLILAEQKDKADAARRNKITCAATEVRWLLPNPLPPGALPDSIDHTFGSYTKVSAAGATFYTLFNKNDALGLGSLTGAQLNPSAPAAALFDLPIPDVTAAGIQSRFTFSANAAVMNVGPASSANPTGLRVSSFTLNNGQLLENGNPVVDGIVFMDAQYGKAPSATSTAGTVAYIRDFASPDKDLTKDPNINQDAWFSLRTVRVVLIARVGQYEKDLVSPASYTVWGSPDPHGVPVTYTVPANDRHYRHKVIELVIPLRNMFWRPQQ